MNVNPWQVDSIKEFYFLKCPECDFTHREETDFENHAVANHPLSSVFFVQSENILENIDNKGNKSESIEPDSTIKVVNESEDQSSVSQNLLFDSKNEDGTSEQCLSISEGTFFLKSNN